MKYTRIEGIVPPVVTPLTCNGDLDIAGLQRHHEYLLKNDVAALFVLGTTGEGPALNQRIKEDMIVKTVENCNNRVPVLAGVSADNLEDYLTLSKFAAAHGADGIVAAPPSYLPLERNELLEFYRILTLEQELPVYVYNMPAMTKIDMQPDLIIEIASLPGIAGYKDSSGKFDNFKTVADALKNRQDFSLFMGPDTLLKPALAAGACGGVNSGANLAPQFYTGLFKAFRAGDMENVERCQRGIEELQKVYYFRENICCGVAAGLKYALQCLKIMDSYLTRPAKRIECEKVIEDFACELQQQFNI